MTISLPPVDPRGAQRRADERHRMSIGVRSARPRLDNDSGQGRTRRGADTGSVGGRHRLVFVGPSPPRLANPPPHDGARRVGTQPERTSVIAAFQGPSPNVG